MALAFNFLRRNKMVSTATIKFSRQEIEQLIKSIVLRLKVGSALGVD
tara:strand:- start:82 stop:222 length:141 start_codon:yes stop_codon:yes gene_type:complete